MNPDASLICSKSGPKTGAGTGRYRTPRGKPLKVICLALARLLVDCNGILVVDGEVLKFDALLLEIES